MPVCRQAGLCLMAQRTLEGETSRGERFRGMLCMLCTFGRKRSLRLEDQQQHQLLRRLRQVKQ